MLEASLILPFFLGFVLILYNFIQIAVIDMHLRHAVSETAKVVSGNMHPVALLYREAKSKGGQSAAGQFVQQAADRITEARALAPPEAGQWADRLERFIPEQMGLVLNRSLKPVVLKYANSKVIRGQNLRICKVTLPDFDEPQNAFFGVEAEYDVKVVIPFYRPTIRLIKSSYEKVWIGR